MVTYAVVAAAGFNDVDFLSRKESGCFDAVIAVDAGLRHMQGCDVSADFVIGDFDSLGYEPTHPNVIRHSPIKDARDLELALDFAVERGAQAIFAYGCLSGRLDHTLAALQNLAAVSEQGLKVVAIAEGVQDDKAGFEDGMAVAFLSGPAALDLPAADHAGVSVFSLSERCTGVTEEGMFYPLENAELTNRTSLGLSNQLIGVPASVRVLSGTVCVMCPARLV